MTDQSETIRQTPSTDQITAIDEAATAVRAHRAAPATEIPTTPRPPLPPELETAISELVEAAGIDGHPDQVLAILRTAVGLGIDPTTRLDLKIVNSALAEMRSAFRIFAPYLDIPKVTIFGSARTQPDDPLYSQTHDVAALIADEGWMVITGAGPGIMEAGMEGAGADQSIGVSIRLPFETGANAVIVGDPKLVSMKYFFTRKLMLVKESLGFVALPGGFGTLDETLELLTLQQTGKSEPVPIVLLDVPGGTYWQSFVHFVQTELASRGMVAEDDMDRVLITDDVATARDEIIGFWRNYDSMRWVDKRLVLRLRSEPTDAEIAELNDRFGYLATEGQITRVDPLGPEVSHNDRLGLPRLAITFDQFQVGSLHRLIRALNDLASAPGRENATD